MKYYIFTYQGESLPIAYKLQQEGHEVIVGIVDNTADVFAKSEKITKEDPLWKKQRLSLFDNMVTKVPARELIDKIKHSPNNTNSFVFFDRNNLFNFAHELLDISIAGNFPTEEDYLMEQDRDAAKEFVKEHYKGITVAPVKDFSKISDAEEFLIETEGIWVLKGRSEDAQTFVPESIDSRTAAKQVIQILQANKKQYENGGFILEKLIPSMIELTPEKIYYDGVPIAVVLYIENKPFGSGNLSVQTGCSQDLTLPISFTDKINDITFPPIVDALAKKHKGLFYWDASLLIDSGSGEIYFGEFCPNRPGYNQIFTELAQCPSVHHYFTAIKNKKNPFTPGSIGASVRFFNINRDIKTEKLSGDIPVSYSTDNEKNIWLWDAQKKDDTIVTVGYDWAVGVVTGSGRSVTEAVNAAYEHITDVSFVGGYYRPKFDYLSRDYPTAILNRLQYGIDKGLYKLP